MTYSFDGFDRCSNRGFVPSLPSRLGAKVCIAALLVLAIAGCASPERSAPVPTADVVNAMPLGIENARFYPGEQHDEILAEFRRAADRQRQALGLGPDAMLPPAQLLAISGGGDNGAFGSGVLVGWTAAGNRPEFELVTGVSTGAILSPFAFLGPTYDTQLRDVYTTVNADDLYIERGFIDAIYNDALSDTTPLWELISKYVDEAMMQAIAAEYEKGRLLLIASTNLDAQRPTIWNVGAIAASGHPEAIDLVRKVLRASSAVPGVFQPVLIDVEVNGTKYQELHVDGGAIAQIFLYPPNLNPEDIAHENRTAYLILNAREDSTWTDVDVRTLSIAGQAISTMIHYSGVNDVMRIYYMSKEEGIDFNLAYIGHDFATVEDGDFDQAYMQALYDYSYQQALNGYPWKKIPPVLSGAGTAEGD
ncbi:MAG: patatin-like phospholipase family protein [Rhodospirillaceae bacterium]|nr:patatin-like phospholipase family protein [Rhodospirillaceae bacterium]